MDLKEVKGSESEGKNNSSPSTSSIQMKTPKSCSDCHTTRTPLWRGGPAGPKSLCNACGIKYNKKRREALGLDTGRTVKGKKKRKSSGGGNGSRSSEFGQSLKMTWMALQRSGKMMNKLREEEKAAVLLMTLSMSRGSAVYA